MAYTNTTIQIIDARYCQIHVLSNGTIEVFPDWYTPNAPLQLDPKIPAHIPQIIDVCTALATGEIALLPASIIAVMVANKLCA